MPFWELSPELTGGIRWSPDSSSCWFPWWRVAVGGGSGRVPYNKLVLWPDRERILQLSVFSSCCHGGRRREMELWRILWPILVALQLFPFREHMRVMSDLTAGVNRGVAPADAPLASARSRRPRRVTDAAISTRTFPLQVYSDDSAAPCWRLVFLSGEAHASIQATADFNLHGRSQGSFCLFVVVQGLFCNIGTAVPYLDASCNVVFLN